jgi:hypothetical protein
MGLDERVCDFPRSAYSHHSRSSIELLSAIDNIVPVIRLNQLICSEVDCPATISKMPLYRDHGHLSIAGAKHLGDKVDLMGLALNADLASSPGSSSP